MIDFSEYFVISLYPVSKDHILEIDFATYVRTDMIGSVVFLQKSVRLFVLFIFRIVTIGSVGCATRRVTLSAVSCVRGCSISSAWPLTRLPLVTGSALSVRYVKIEYYGRPKKVVESLPKL